MKVWISYAYTAKEQRLADRITSRLSEAGIEVISGKETIRAGESVFNQIAAGIADADVAVILISPATDRSEYVTTEIALLLSAQQSGRLSRIIPVLVSRDATVPVVLRDVAYLDASREDRVRDAIDKLIELLKSNEAREPIKQPTEDELAQWKSAQEAMMETEAAEMEKRSKRLLWNLGVVAIVLSGLAVVPLALSVALGDTDFLIALAGVLVGSTLTFVGAELYRVSAMVFPFMRRLFGRFMRDFSSSEGASKEQ